MKHILMGVSTAILLFLTGCETVVEVELPEFTPQLVVNSFFSPDTVWRVNVSRSVSILSTEEPQPLSNAVVQLFKDDVPLERLTYTEDGWYQSVSHRPVSGSRYKITASADNFQSVTATDAVPQAVPVLSVSSKDTVGEWEQERKIVTFEFSDPPAVENFYQLSLSSSHYSGVKTYYNTVYFSSNDPVLASLSGFGSEDSDAAFSGDYAVFSDALFSGKTYKMTVFVDYFRDEPNLSVLLSVISEDYYWYVRSDEKRQDSHDNLFAEPVQMYSNVQNGLGIFAGFISSRVPVDN